MSQSRTRKAYSWIIICSLVIGLVLAAILIETTEQAHFEDLHRVGEERLNLYASTVEAEHERFNYLPFIVAQDHQVLQLLNTQNSNTSRHIASEAVNKKLQSWQNESNADTLYLMDAKGIVVASSNWTQPSSFIGNDYHFRPYFKDAINGNAGRFFAIGVTTGQPGLFLSRPVFSQGKIVGVAVLKINMSVLETNWNAGGEDVWVSDSDGVIFLSSNPAWRYHSLSALPAHVLTRLKEAQKYSHHSITQLNLDELPASPQGDRIIQLIGKETSKSDKPVSHTYLLHHRKIADLDWSLYYLSDLKELAQSKYNALLISVLVTALVAVVGMFVLSRLRHQQQLEWRVAQRTEELNQSNTHLTREVDERVRAEKALRQTHEELIQAEKLGALGQISAELVHEISQPIQASHTFLASTKLLIKREEYQLAQENLQEIDKLIRRVSSIVTHLKTFASKSRGTLSRVELKQVVDNALMVLNSKIESSAIELIWVPEDTSIAVKADEIKVEQILINLIRNAIDAIQSHDSENRGRIEINLSASSTHAIISVSDNGCGISPDNLPMLFNPFFTTKPPGKGMGLGLSVSYGIAEEFGGRLEVEPNPDQGTTFSLILSLSASELNHG